MDYIEPDDMRSSDEWPSWEQLFWFVIVSVIAISLVALIAHFLIPLAFGR